MASLGYTTEDAVTDGAASTVPTSAPPGHAANSGNGGSYDHARPLLPGVHFGPENAPNLDTLAANDEMDEFFDFNTAAIDPSPPPPPPTPPPILTVTLDLDRKRTYQVQLFQPFASFVPSEFSCDLCSLYKRRCDKQLPCRSCQKLGVYCSYRHCGLLFPPPPPLPPLPPPPRLPPPPPKKGRRVDFLLAH